MNLNKTLAAALLAAFAAVPAFADKGGHGNGHGRDMDREHGRVAQLDQREDRRDARDTFAERHAGRDCPPGLDKKDNGCMAPGLVKHDTRRVIVGQALPRTGVRTVPRAMLRDLPAARPGYRYAVVDNQVVLVSRRNTVVNILRNTG